MENQVDVTDGRGCGVTQSELFNPAEQAAQAAGGARRGASPPRPPPLAQAGMLVSPLSSISSSMA